MSVGGHVGRPRLPPLSCGTATGHREGPPTTAASLRPSSTTGPAAVLDVDARSVRTRPRPRSAWSGWTSRAGAGTTDEPDIARPRRVSRSPRPQASAMSHHSVTSRRPGGPADHRPSRSRSRSPRAASISASTRRRQAQAATHQCDRVLSPPEPRRRDRSPAASSSRSAVRTGLPDRRDRVVVRRAGRALQAVEAQPEIAHPDQRMRPGDLQHHAPPSVPRELERRTDRRRPRCRARARRPPRRPAPASGRHLRPGAVDRLRRHAGRPPRRPRTPPACRAGRPRRPPAADAVGHRERRRAGTAAHIQDRPTAGERLRRPPHRRRRLVAAARRPAALARNSSGGYPHGDSGAAARIASGIRHASSRSRHRSSALTAPPPGSRRPTPGSTRSSIQLPQDLLGVLTDPRRRAPRGRHGAVDAGSGRPRAAADRDRGRARSGRRRRPPARRTPRRAAGSARRARPAASRSSSQAAAVRSANAARSWGISDSRCATRASFVANRSSSARPGRPRTSHVAANSLSLPAARMNGRSLAWNIW